MAELRAWIGRPPACYSPPPPKGVEPLKFDCICLLYGNIVATCIAAHFAVLCFIIITIKKKTKKKQKISKNSCLVFLNSLFLFCSVIHSL